MALERVTIETASVSDVLDLFAAGLKPEQIMEELPDLEPGDLEVCLRFASHWLDHPVLVA